MTVMEALLAGAVIGALMAVMTLRAVYLARGVALTTERDLLRERIVDLELADRDDQRTAGVLAPLGETLLRVERQVGVLERDRLAQWGELGARLDQVGATTTRLQQETAALAGALKSSNISGTWGETQLRRLLEHAGMLSRCDFEEQVGARARDGVAVRPDVVVHLPGERTLVIDSKAPLTSYLAAQREGIDDAARSAALRAHARALSGHLDALAAKGYWAAFAGSPEMVVAFVPSDAVLSAALLADPAIFERAISRRVVLASPSTLLALLRTVAFSWQQDDLNANARELLELGRTLYERLATLGRHTDKLGSSLHRSVEAYNALLGTMESRVLVTARKMHELGLADQPPAAPSPLQDAVRPLTARELIDAVDRDMEQAGESARPQLDFRAGVSGDGGEAQRSAPAS
ncbi:MULTISPECIES: DNA recombination protein RmuC [unclassified Allobranchiibius]|uniref:DNA recombination protein RmuC n=1 Tax=unclassified Allobranchiibius TaxID=2649857 RepID=UPI001AA14E17|nr:MULTISPECIES: DNA recombination protein RmuC [unclassified Allobranchiibius]MBO1767912.1 DNA recombination protein RmuC [Allobranchiibius sp. GilTou38]UIJ36215.1 DNA recombination protein RmuC [Allobranchiibius sp. GilTou73]